MSNEVVVSNERDVENLKPLVQESEKGKTWPQYVAVLSALFAVFNAGIHFGWPSPFIPKIQSPEYPFNVTSAEANLITITGPIGDIFGSILFSSLVDVIGRKYTILLIGLPQIASLWMIYFSWYSKLLLYSARFLGGLSEAACFTILPIYIGEVAEPKIRGRLGSYLTLILYVGILIVNFVGSYFTIYQTALCFSFLPILFIAIFSQMPESPYYLVMKLKNVDAKLALQNLRGKKDVVAELTDISTAVRRQMTQPGRYKDLFLNKSNRRACTVIAGLRIIQQLSGVAALIVYMQVLFSRSTSLPKHISSSLTFLFEIVANFCAIFVVDKVGRKPLLIYSCLGCLLVLSLQGSYYAVIDLGMMSSHKLDYVPIIAMPLFMIVWSIGIGSIVNLMIGEIFSANIKAKASCLMNMIFALLMFAVTKIFQVLSDHYGMCTPFFLFAIIQLVGVVFIWRYVPETKGKTLEEIQAGLRGDIYMENEDNISNTTKV